MRASHARRLRGATLIVGLHLIVGAILITCLHTPASARTRVSTEMGDPDPDYGPSPGPGKSAGTQSIGITRWENGKAVHVRGYTDRVRLGGYFWLKLQSRLLILAWRR